jgi:hypothetical protein
MSWSRFFRRKRSDAELQDEIEAFLTEETAGNEARGMPPGEARRQARIRLGNAHGVRESLWAENSPRALTNSEWPVLYERRTRSSILQGDCEPPTCPATLPR